MFPIITSLQRCSIIALFTPRIEIFLYDSFVFLQRPIEEGQWYIHFIGRLLSKKNRKAAEKSVTVAPWGEALLSWVILTFPKMSIDYKTCKILITLTLLSVKYFLSLSSFLQPKGPHTLPQLFLDPM